MDIISQAVSFYNQVKEDYENGHRASILAGLTAVGVLLTIVGSFLIQITPDLVEMVSVVMDGIVRLVEAF